MIKWNFPIFFPCTCILEREIEKKKINQYSLLSNNDIKTFLESLAIDQTNFYIIILNIVVLKLLSNKYFMRQKWVWKLGICQKVNNPTKKQIAAEGHQWVLIQYSEKMLLSEVNLSWSRTKKWNRIQTIYLYSKTYKWT